MRDSRTGSSDSPLVRSRKKFVWSCLSLQMIEIRNPRTKTVRLGPGFYKTRKSYQVLPGPNISSKIWPTRIRTKYFKTLFKWQKIVQISDWTRPEPVNIFSNDIEIAFGYPTYCKSVEITSTKPLCIEYRNVLRTILWFLMTLKSFNLSEMIIQKTIKLWDFIY